MNEPIPKATLAAIRQRIWARMVALERQRDADVRAFLKTDDAWYRLRRLYPDPGQLENDPIRRAQ
jgi:hypothetical protein